MTLWLLLFCSVATAFPWGHWVVKSTLDQHIFPLETWTRQVSQTTAVVFRAQPSLYRDQVLNIMLQDTNRRLELVNPDIIVSRGDVVTDMVVMSWPEEGGDWILVDTAIQDTI